MTTENIIIQIREDGSRVVSRSIGEIGTAANKSQDSIAMLKNALRGLTGLLGLAQLKQWMDTWTMATGIVNIFTESIEETTQIMGRLYDIAQATRQPIDATAQSYHQLTLAATALGASQDQLLTFTEGVNKAFAIQKTPANTARGGIIQLGQAMNEGIVRAQEYNSMINSMPLVLKVVAKNLDGAGGSIAKLRQMMLDGKLTSKAFFEAFLQGANELDTLFERSGRTIGQAFTILNNAAAKYVGELDQAIGISVTFFKLAKFGAENMDLLAKSIIVLAAPGILNGVIKLFAAINAGMLAITANPVGAAIVAITLAITALTVFRNDLLEMSGTVGTVAGQFYELVDLLGQGLLVVVDALTQSQGNFNGSLEEGSVWVKALGSALDVAIVIMQTIMIVGSEVAFVFKMIGMEIGAIAAQITALVTLDFKGFTFIGDALKEDVARARKDLDAWQAEVMNKGKDTGALNVRGKVDQFIPPTPSGISKTGPGEDFAKKAKKANKEVETFAKTLLTLEKQLKPSIAAEQEMTNATKILDKAVSKGLISQERRTELMAALQLKYEDIKDPMGAYIRDQNAELEGLKMTSQQQAISNEIYKVTQEMRSKGIILTDAEISRARQMSESIQQQKQVQSELNTIYDQTQGAQERLTAKNTALAQSYANGTINLDYYKLKLNETALAAANLNIQIGNGTYEEAAMASFGRILEGYNGMLSGMTDSFGSFFTSFTDGFADSVGRAIVYSEDLGEALHNVAASAVSELISSLVKLGMQWVVNALLGQTLAATTLATATAASVTAAGVTAAAWAPAAAMVSLASFGANSVPAISGIAMTTAFSSAMASVGGMAGFAAGGYTGNGGLGDVAGVVHGKEFVVNAAATERNRATLEAMNAGRPIAAAATYGSSTGQSSMNVAINNYGNDEVEVRQLTEQDVEVIIRKKTPQIMADSFANPNSKPAKSLRNNYKVERNLA